MKKDTNIKSLRGQNEGQFSALLGAPGAGPQTPGPQPPRPVLAPVPPLPTKVRMHSKYIILKAHSLH